MSWLDNTPHVVRSELSYCIKSRIENVHLVALYCATPPLLRAMGFLVSQHGQLGAMPPPAFLSVSPLESMWRGGAIPPPPHKRGISAILARYRMKTRQNAWETPLCDIILKGYCTIWRGISHWAAKPVTPPRTPSALWFRHMLGQLTCRVAMSINYYFVCLVCFVLVRVTGGG